MKIIPDRFIDTFVKQFPETYRVLPESMKTVERSFNALLGDRENFRFIPDSIRDTCVLKALTEATDRRTLYNKIPAEGFTGEIILEACKKKTVFVSEANRHLYTTDLMKQIIDQDCYHFCHFPKSMLNQEICDYAVSKQGELLVVVPDEYIHRGLFEAILTDDHTYGPDGLDVLGMFRDPELILPAYKKFENLVFRDYPLPFDYIHPDVMTPELIDYALEKNPRLIDSIPVDKITERNYERLIRRDAFYIRHVPEERITGNLCHAAYQKEVSSIAYFPAKYQTTELLLDAVTRDPTVLSAIPPEKRTLDICRKAMESGSTEIVPSIPYNALALEHFEKYGGQFTLAQLDYPGFAESVLTFNPDCYGNFPEELKYNRELAHKAVELKWENVFEILPEYRDITLLPMVHAHPDMLSAFPTGVVDDAFLLEYLKDDPWKVMQTPLEYMTPSACRKVVEETFGKDQKDYRIFRYIPYGDICLQGLKELKNDDDVVNLFKCIKPTLRSKEVIEEAFNRNMDVFRFVNDHFITPEMCVKVSLDNDWNTWNKKPAIPDAVRNGNNMFTCYRRLDMFIKHTPTFDEVQKIYDGEPFKSRYGDILFVYDKSNGTFSRPEELIQNKQTGKSPKLK